MSELLVGTIAEIRSRDELTGRLVARIDPAEGGEQVTAVGVIATAPAVGEQLFLAGEWSEHPRFGRQFAIERLVDPAVDEQVALGYLSAGVLPHVGPAAARSIVEAFGSDTLRVVALSPERLTAFRGITAERLPAIRSALRETLPHAAVIGLIDPHGVSLRVARRVSRRYGAAAVEVIRAHPWRMAAEVTGIGFRTADRVGLGLGADPADPSRLEAAVLQSLRDAAAEAGHTVVERPAITAAAATLTGRPMAEAQAAVDRLVVAGKVVATERPAGLALARLAAAERFTALRLRVMAAWPDPAPLAIDDAEIDGFAYAEGVPFDESQRRAIRGALVHRVSVITGNPGTGKTTIVRALLEAAERRGLRVALVSPTGRAAKRLEEATGRPASTIHRYLGFRPDGPWDGPAELPDLLVVDESSMLDVRLAARLLEPLLPWTRLCFVGDIDQLPAVGPGNVLADLVRSPLVGVFRLTTIHRTEGGSAVPKLAAQIRAGVRAPVFTPPTTRFIPAESADEVAAEIEAVVARAGDRRLEIVVIAPSRRGPCGVEALNRRLAPIFNPDAGQPALPRRGEEPPLRSGDRIVVDGNHYGHGLFNGDIVEATEVGPQRVVIRLGDGSERVLRPAEALELLEPAWAMTVHRAQGSEFPVVVIPLHASAYMLLERRLFYTAVSRASSAVVVVGQPKAMAIAAGRFDPAGRRTLLRGLLAEPEPPALLLRDLDDEQEAMVAVAAAAAPAPTIAGVAVDEDDDIF